jgi:hypothetical protein
MSDEEIANFCPRIRNVYARFNEIKQKREQENQNCTPLEAEFVMAYIILYLDVLFPNGKCLTGPADKAKLALSHQNFQTNANWKIINKTPQNQTTNTEVPTKPKQPQTMQLEDDTPTNRIPDLWDTSNHLCTGSILPSHFSFPFLLSLPFYLITYHHSLPPYPCYSFLFPLQGTSLLTKWHLNFKRK